MSVSVLVLDHLFVVINDSIKLSLLCQHVALVLSGNLAPNTSGTWVILET